MRHEEAEQASAGTVSGGPEDIRNFCPCTYPLLALCNRAAPMQRMRINISVRQGSPEQDGIPLPRLVSACRARCFQSESVELVGQAIQLPNG